MSPSAIQVGDTVKWPWGNGEGSGKVVERFTDDVERTLKGSQIKRTADRDKPAFLIRQDDGAQVLKSVTEIEKA